MCLSCCCSDVSNEIGRASFFCVKTELDAAAHRKNVAFCFCVVGC